MATLRVLILEDDEDIIELVRSVLEPTYECFAAGNGLEGLQQVREGEPDLIVCDIMMPVMDGWEFMKHLRQTAGYEDYPVIFLSALSSQEHIRSGYKEGAALYLTKPIDPNRFKRNFDLFVKDRELVARPKRKRIEQLTSFNFEQRTVETGGAAPVDDPMAPPWASLQGPARATGGAPQQPPPTPGPRPQDRSASFVILPKTPSVESRPADRPASSERSTPMVRPEAAGGSGGERPRLLIVDDDRDTCHMVQTGLGDAYDVLIAGDGIAAIEQAVRYKPDIFIIDGMLPRMTGYQLTVMLKKNIEFYRSPIVFISGKATPRDQQYAQKLGINHFLAKPFTVLQLRQVLMLITDQPDFTIHRNRPEWKQIHLEQLQRMETHRSELPTGSPEQLDRRQLDNLMKKKLN